MIARKLSQRIKDTLCIKKQYNNVLLVEGARQAGKTTLIRQTLKELGTPFLEIDLEEQKEFTERLDHCRNFEEFTELLEVEYQFKPGADTLLFIDEAQESRQLGGFIRFMKEKWPFTQVILSGSIMARIFRDNARFPVGRVTIFHLQPFSFEEFLSASGQKVLSEKIQSFSIKHPWNMPAHEGLLKLMAEYLEVGGLPEVVCHYFAGENWHRTREDILLGYYNDFKRIYGEERQAYFIAALKTTAHVLGCPFKNSHVSLLLDGGKNKEIIESLSQLEAWKMIFVVPQRGPKVETHFHPKRYLFDLGITKQLREAVIPKVSLAAASLIEDRGPLGGLLENFVCLSLIDQASEISGFKKTSSGSEVDFVIKREDKVIPIECKSTRAVKNSHLSGLRDFMEIYKLSLGVVISLAPFEIRRFPDKKEIMLLPIYLAERLTDLIKRERES